MGQYECPCVCLFVYNLFDWLVGFLGGLPLVVWLSGSLVGWLAGWLAVVFIALTGSRSLQNSLARLPSCLSACLPEYESASRVLCLIHPALCLLAFQVTFFRFHSTLASLSHPSSFLSPFLPALMVSCLPPRLPSPCLFSVYS